jgi:hypothetical protein
MVESAPNLQVPWWLRHAHAQTIMPRLDFRKFTVPAEHERHELPDGDFVDVHWVGRHQAGPLVVLLPGMQGGHDGIYIRALLWELSRSGFRAAVLCHRGGTVPNRLARFYHAGFIDDLAWLISLLRAKEPRTPLFAVGFSLGGSMLIRYLAETGHGSGLAAAAAVSMTFSLASTAGLAGVGVNRLYQYRILRSYKRVASAKSHLPEYAPRVAALDSLQSVRAFDEVFTGPLNGFTGADDYYRRCSSRQFLPGLEVPFLILNAEDDPIVARETIPSARELRGHVRLELPRHGGHLGFLCRTQSQLGYYHPHRLTSFFRERLGAHESLSQDGLDPALLALEAPHERGGTHQHAHPARSAQ